MNNRPELRSTLGIVSLSCVALSIAIILAGLLQPALLRTPDQLGDYYFLKGNFSTAAQSYDSPMRKGVSWYRDGEFEKAMQNFTRLSSAEARFNQGNCLTMLGRYQDAVQQFDLALGKQPGWTEAAENRDLALARAEAVETEGGDAGDQKIGADEIVFDKNAKKGGQDTEVDTSSPNQKSIQELWLRKVQTKPADFLKFKFAYQATLQEDSP
ncbi:MAG: hypothetical protein ACE361_19995 [Aureliella sp.]